SPTREPSKRQRKASKPGAAEEGGGGGAAVAPTTEQRRWCQESGCTTLPSYGKAPRKKAEFCRKHRKQGMVSVVDKRCGHRGCTKRPGFGMDGSRHAFCNRHAQRRMVHNFGLKTGVAARGVARHVLLFRSSTAVE
ncbi:unnamed protein product, partial [Ectocarpus fasciculatus]